MKLTQQLQLHQLHHRGPSIPNKYLANIQANGFGSGFNGTSKTFNVPSNNVTTSTGGCFPVCYRGDEVGSGGSSPYPGMFVCLELFFVF